MAYENIRLSSSNVVLIDSYFYTFVESKNVLRCKIDDGDTAFEYPTDTSIGTTVKSTQYDGYYFWTMQDHPSGGLLVKKWRIANNICVFVNSFNHINDTDFTYSSEAIGLEYYTTIISDISSTRTLTLNTAEYYDNVIVSGTRLYLGPNYDGNTEEVTVTDVAAGTIVLSNKTSYKYTVGDKVSLCKSYFIFNNYTGTDSTYGSLIRFDSYTGNYISLDSNVDYKNITATTFYRFDNILPSYPNAHALIYTKGTNAKLRNMSDLIDIIDATTLSDTFTGVDYTLPDSIKWGIISGAPRIKDNTLFIDLIAGTTDEVQSKYYLMNDFEVQVSGTLDHNITTLSGLTYLEQYVQCTFPYSSTSEYKCGVCYIDTKLPDRTNLDLELTADVVSSTYITDTSPAGSYTVNRLNGTYITAGHIGNAVAFDGVNDYLDIAPDISLNNTSFTISIWVYPSIKSSYGGFCGSDITATQRPPSLYVKDVTSTTGDLHFGFGDGSTWYSHTISNYFNQGAGHWYHVVYVLDKVNKMEYIYRNGINIWSDTETSYANSGAIKFFGKCNNYFPGILDQIRIYREVLSQADIEKLHNEVWASPTFNYNLVGPQNDSAFNFYTSLDGHLETLTPTTASGSTNFFIKATRSSSNLVFDYKEVTSSGTPASWVNANSFSVHTSDSKISLGALAYNASVTSVKFDDLLYLNGNARYTTDSVPLYGTMNMDNVRSDQVTIIPIYDITIYNSTLYRLQHEATYYGTDNSWVSYNYQTSPIRPFVDFITVGADPVILPANGKNVSVVTAVVQDQYGNGAVNKPVIFTDDNDIGYITIPTVNTDSQYGTGKAVTVYKSGLDVTPVVVTGRATQYD